MVTGGSTNAVLHLIAMSRACQDPAVRIGLDDFQRISDETPFLADLKPSGKYVMEDVQNIGGTPGVIKFMIDNGMFDGSQMTVTGKTWAENVADHPGLTPGQEIIKPLSDPVLIGARINSGPARRRRDACSTAPDSPVSSRAGQGDGPPADHVRQRGAGRRRRQDHGQGGRDLYGRRESV